MPTVSVARALKQRSANWIGDQKEVLMEHAIAWNLHFCLAIGIAGMVLACWVRQVRRSGYDEENNFVRNG